MFSTQNAKNAFDFFFWRAEENCFDRALLNQPKGNEWSGLSIDCSAWSYRTNQTRIIDVAALAK
jgi:hypothetical protein